MTIATQRAPQQRAPQAQYILGRDRDTLLHALKSSGKRFGVIEAEFGSRYISEEDGATLAWNHHGPNSKNRPPSLMGNYDGNLGAIELIGLTHIDPDNFIGGLGMEGIKGPELDDFSKLVAHVDMNGLHMLGTAPIQDKALEDRLYAYIAWSEANITSKLHPDQPLETVTEHITNAFVALHKIFANDMGMIEDGRTWRQQLALLNKDSFCDIDSQSNVITRFSSRFCNNLYATPKGVAARAIVAFNSHEASITLSFQRPIGGLSAVEIMQSALGQLAGGHVGIASSPRGTSMMLADWINVTSRVRGALGGQSQPHPISQR